MTRKNPALADEHLYKLLLRSCYSSSQMYSHGCQTSIDSAFTPPRKKILARAKVNLQLCSRPTDLTLELCFRGQDLMVTQQREYVLYWTMQTLRIRALHNALRETFLNVNKNEISTANVSGSETSFRRPLASNKKKKKRKGRGRGLKKKTQIREIQ